MLTNFNKRMISILNRNPHKKDESDARKGM